MAIAAQAIVEEVYAKVTNTDGTQIRPVGSASDLINPLLEGCTGATQIVAAHS